MAHVAHRDSGRQMTDDGSRRSDGGWLTSEVGRQTVDCEFCGCRLGLFRRQISALRSPLSPVRHPSSVVRHLVAVMVALAALTATAASKAKLSTGRVMNPVDILHAAPGAVLGDRYYAEVNSASLPKLYSDFREQLFEYGIVKREDSYTCKHFAALFAEMAQARYFKESYRSRGQARALAIGSIWYVRDDDQVPHAIVQVLTERGRVYFEPQTGKEIALSPKEEASAYFRFF